MKKEKIRGNKEISKSIIRGLRQSLRFTKGKKIKGLKTSSRLA
jgi:hypothetical protein